MSRSSVVSRFRRPLLGLFLSLGSLGSLALLPAARAQTPLAGNVFDGGGGGPLLAGQVYTHGGFTVPVGQTLTVQPGAVIKSTGGGVSVQGTLAVNGTAAQPVIFTSIHDDAGGDTNGNGGATLPAPDQWAGVSFGPASDASTLTRAIVRCTGVGFSAGIALDAADVKLDACLITLGQWGGLVLANDARPVVTNCSFLACGGRPAVFGASVNALPGFANNVSSGNGAGNGIRVEHGTVAGAVSVDASSMLGGAHVLATSVVVPAGAHLVLGEGVVLKSQAFHGVSVAGTLDAAGTAAAPVVFTTEKDDAHGGDTNGDGPSAGVPDTWSALEFQPGSDASRLAHAIVRYGGVNFRANVELAGASPTLEDCVLEHGAHGGLDLNQSPAKPVVKRCAFLSNSEQAVRGVRADALGGFADNTAAGNGQDSLWIHDGTVATDATLPAAAQLNGALVYASSILVPAGRKLSIEPGVVLKASGVVGVHVDGALDVLGTPGARVVLTTYPDDQHGGDTNGGGPSQGAPDTWTGLSFGAGAAASTVEHLLVRYSGVGFSPGVRCDSQNVALRAVRVEHAQHGGILLNAHAGPARDLVAYATGAHGIRLGGGSFDLVRATAAQNGGTGILGLAGYTGTVKSSISWGNGTAFGGLAAAQIVHCAGNGLSGGIGNHGQDPLFLNAAAGELALQPGSPCIDAGDVLDLPAGLDPRGMPRRQDGDLDGFPVVDQGAHEFSNVEFRIGGVPAPLQVLTFETTGTNVFASALLLVAEPGPELYVDPYGPLFLDFTGPWLSFPWPAQPATVPLLVPQGFPSVTLHLQVVGLTAGGSRGNVSNPVALSF